MKKNYIYIQINKEVMLILSMLIMVYGQYTIYPTINSTFQYPLDKVFEGKGFVYDIHDSQSPFTIQQAIAQGSPQTLPNIGDIIYTSQSLDNYFAALSQQSDFFMASVFQVGHSGELILQLTYIVNASFYTCYNLVLYRNDSVIINCIELKTNFVTLFSFGQVNTLNTTNITIKPDQVQNSAISILRNTITFTYQFETHVDIYQTHFNQQFILSIEHSLILNGTYLKIYQNRQGVVFALKNNSITVHYDLSITTIQAPQNMTFIDFDVQFFGWGQEYITVYLLSCHQIESLHVYQNGTYKYHSQVEFKQEYSRIFISFSSILLYGDKQFAYYKIDQNGQLYYYNFLTINTKCQNLIYIWSAQVLFCISNQYYTAYQQGAPYLFSKNGVQDIGTLKLITSNIEGYTDIVSVKYNPLQPNDQGIYYQFENQKYAVQGRRKFTYMDLSQVIVGSNLTYNYNGTDQQMQKAIILHTNTYGGINFHYRGYKHALRMGNYSLKYLSAQFLNDNTTVYAQKVRVLANIIQVKIQPFNTYGQEVIQIILHSTNKIYIYHFEEFVALNFQSLIDMTIQSKTIEIQDIQTFYSIIVILTQNPNRVFYTFSGNQQAGPIQMQLDYSKEILQIATNTLSYFYLLVNQVGQAQVVRFWGRGQGQGYKIIQRIKYPDGYLKSIIGPVSSGIFFYFYTETQSDLYFLQKEFIKQIDVQHNMFFTKVDTSSYQLVQNKLTYSYSNKFFYVVVQDKKGNSLLNIYQGSYQAIKILRSSLQLNNQLQQIASTVYQDVSAKYGADLILLPLGKGIVNQRLLITHKPYLINLPEFSWKQNYQMKVTFTVNNNFTQTQVQSTLSVNQSYLQLTQQPKHLLNQTYKIKNNKFNFDVSKMFNGPVVNYQLFCDGCEIQSYQLPIDDKFDTYKQDYSSYLLKEEEHDGKKTQILYLLKMDGSLFSLDINAKSEIQLLHQGKDDICQKLFQEINTKNPSWICQTAYQITFYTYNPSNKKMSFSSIEFLGFSYDSYYTLGYIQLFSVLSQEEQDVCYFSIIQYNIVKDKQIINILIIQKPLDTLIYYSKSIILDNNSTNPIIGIVGINPIRVQYLIITTIAVNETLVRFQPYPFTSFNTQNTYVYQPIQIGKPEKRDNNIFIKLYQSGILNPQIFELKFALDGRYTEQESICHFNQLNYTHENFNNYFATQNGKQLIIVQNNPQTVQIKQQTDFLIFDLELCGKTKLVNPYYQLKQQLNTVNYSNIHYLNNDTVMYITSGELSIFKSTGQVTGTYKEIEEDPKVSIIASNPVSQVSQSLDINNNPNKQSSSGLAWYWIVLIIISSLVAAFYGYVFIRQKVFTRNVPSNQENTYMEMR
ncbi:hypothetical protein pb186bvf_007975 [Paramecium bursaria]